MPCEVTGFGFELFWEGGGSLSGKVGAGYISVVRILTVSGFAGVLVMIS
jgi:hypothetical protein